MKIHEIEITLEEHLLTSEIKIKHLGYGEWVEEPDEVLFKYRDYECRILRLFVKEPCCKDEHYFGGHLCGYVAVPAHHAFYKKNYQEIDVDCHGGLTFSECSDRHWIGFDCAHSMDYTPSIEIFKKTNLEMIEIRKKFPIPETLEKHYLFNPTYKNIQFCIDECKSIVDQLILKEKENDLGK